MKTVILALLVLVVVSQGEALRCYKKGCLSIYEECSSIRIETCTGSNQVCGIINGSDGHRRYHMRRCMKADECTHQSNSGIAYSYGRCCSRDLCN
ncbi:hypothetical protein KUCAC02_027301 [Chaenocephalus aceratus]|uniref:Uncharacterized protein n=1 Tax=Chaenocephalus aceratus TaxID=36190 RepID=A0ACB9W4G0_CHAAC|nr:hypothetical protein KUCAC02_027301 [Chaenocephalus aceratus]